MPRTDPPQPLATPSPEAGPPTTFMQAILPRQAEPPGGPALWRVRHLYPAALLPDCLAGLTVGLVAIPLALAFAISSGMPPQSGLYTAILAGFIVSVFGGTRVQIAGPTGAFVVVVADVVARHGVEGLLTATLLGGIILILLGLARLGAIIKYIPYPVVTGFTSGIAIIIFTGQLRDFFGLTTDKLSDEFLPRMGELARAFPTADPAAVGVGLGSLALLLLWPKVTAKVPSPVIVLILASIANAWLGAETIGDRFGVLPATLPEWTLPQFSIAKIREVFPAALTIAILGGIESLLSAVVADGTIGTKHDANQELIAQGMANCCTPFVGGLPATGAIARTMTNIRSGGQGPVAGIVHSLVVLIAVLVAMPLIAQVPLAALAAILTITAWNMSEIKQIRGLLKGPKSDVLVLFLTLGLTVFVDLIVAVEAGVILASLLFIKRLTELVTIEEVVESQDPGGFRGGQIPPGVQVYTIGGPFFFGVLERFESTLSITAPGTHTVILRMKAVPAIDATALHGLERVIRRLQGQGKRILLTGLKEQPRRVLANAGLLERIGEANIYPRLGDAIRALGGDWPSGSPGSANRTGTPDAS